MPKAQQDASKSNIHKDFHGAFSHCIKYIYEKYGKVEMTKCLEQIAERVYKPLIEAIAKEGLQALEKHWQRIFTLEAADFNQYYENGILVLNVKKCPAIMHMKKSGFDIFEKYCEHTRIMNKKICDLAGYSCSVTYNQKEGYCEQRFWKEKGDMYDIMYRVHFML